MLWRAFLVLVYAVCEPNDTSLHIPGYFYECSVLSFPFTVPMLPILEPSDSQAGYGMNVKAVNSLF